MKSLPGHLSSVAVILAGGYGTRFWPVSRRTFPKQFLSLTPGGPSLIQETVNRIELLSTPEGVLVVTGETHKAIAEKQLPDCTVLTEPLAKNTAPCIGLAALQILKDVGDVPMFVLPADHVIAPDEALQTLLAEAILLAAEQDVLVTIGVRPRTPETGFGYIERGERYSPSSEAYRVKAFVEKPDFPTAVHYLESGNYFWNSGMFVWRPSIILENIKQHVPALGDILEQISRLKESKTRDEQFRKLFSKIEPVSVDFGVMEKAENVLMLLAENFSWNDVGSWDAWTELLRTNVSSAENLSQGAVLFENCTGCTVIDKSTQGQRMIAGVGLEDLIVVQTDDAVLICKADTSQDVKKVVDQLKAQNRIELT